MSLYKLAEVKDTWRIVSESEDVRLPAMTSQEVFTLYL